MPQIEQINQLSVEMHSQLFSYIGRGSGIGKLEQASNWCCGLLLIVKE
jgi:hypothetical protein